MIALQLMTTFKGRSAASMQRMKSHSLYIQLACPALDMMHLRGENLSFSLLTPPDCLLCQCVDGAKIFFLSLSTYLYVYGGAVVQGGRGVWVCVCVYVYLHGQIHVPMHAHLFACISICVYIYICACTHGFECSLHQCV